MAILSKGLKSAIRQRNADMAFQNPAVSAYFRHFIQTFGCKFMVSHTFFSNIWGPPFINYSATISWRIDSFTAATPLPIQGVLFQGHMSQVGQLVRVRDKELYLPLLRPWRWIVVQCKQWTQTQPIVHCHPVA